MRIVSLSVRQAAFTGAGAMARHEPASMFTLLAVLVVSIGLDYGWKRSRHTGGPLHVQVRHWAIEVLR